MSLMEFGSAPSFRITKSYSVIFVMSHVRLTNETVLP